MNCQGHLIRSGSILQYQKMNAFRSRAYNLVRWCAFVLVQDRRAKRTRATFERCLWPACTLQSAPVWLQHAQLVFSTGTLVFAAAMVLRNALYPT